MKIHSGSLTAVIYVLLPLTISWYISITCNNANRKMGLYWNILSAHCQAILSWLSVTKWNQHFPGTLICQPEAEEKQRCRKCECEGVTDTISQGCLSRTDKTSRCAFRTSILHRPSSLPITHTQRKKNHLKHAPSFISRAVDSLHGSVSLKKAHTPILIAEQNVERG